MGAAQYYGKPHFVWSGISSGQPSFRYDGNDIFFDDVSPALIFAHEVNWKLLQLLNSKVTTRILSLIAPTMHFQAGDIKQIPVHPEVKSINNAIAEECVRIAKYDWDSYENSWDFKRNPLV